MEGKLENRRYLAVQHVGRIMKGQERLPGGRGWKVSYVLEIGFLEVEWK